MHNGAGLLVAPRVPVHPVLLLAVPELLELLRAHATRRLPVVCAHHAQLLLLLLLHRSLEEWSRLRKDLPALECVPLVALEEPGARDGLLELGLLAAVALEVPVHVGLHFALLRKAEATALALDLKVAVECGDDGRVALAESFSLELHARNSLSPSVSRSVVAIVLCSATATPVSSHVSPFHRRRESLAVRGPMARRGSEVLLLERRRPPIRRRRWPSPVLSLRSILSVEEMTAAHWRWATAATSESEL
mmetsp:Transcript_11007/g.44945  ORF Transcript_11007/g.44945 Transcript_11007/m.44945 type:complete len:249 (+) Transcript_11007:470-1216(+)